ncbi:uncharacterized protein FIBRA_03180 [Fibroporia radiculosa]|uniref:Uncharacterized protein n=1 Tax=Fibroporia radiculosa TaxID=599839 RepID=J4HVU7_9APHY|nr:uncharacterized protein FIBRA_03180 [Fibroporia radiculosa]CCM01132.1 predicted protein [Fibroporia radiculosa]
MFSQLCDALGSDSPNIPGQPPVAKLDADVNSLGILDGASSLPVHVNEINWEWASKTSEWMLIDEERMDTTSPHDVASSVTEPQAAVRKRQMAVIKLWRRLRRKPSPALAPEPRFVHDRSYYRSGSPSTFHNLLSALLKVQAANMDTLSRRANYGRLSEQR